MSNIDEQFVEFIVKSLVGNPDEVKLERRIDEKGVLIELSVDPEDLGRVIGKRGATAQSIRTLLRALGTKNDARYNLKIVDTGDGSHRSAPATTSDDDQSPADDSNQDDAANNSGQDEEVKNDDHETEVEETPEEMEEEAAPNHINDAEDEQGHSLADKTRRELEELDDLDI